MCASSTPKAQLAPPTNHKNNDVDTTSAWENPMVISFTVVGILFLLSLILGALNFYIWYVERRNRRHHNGLDRWTGTYGGPSYENTAPKTRSTNLAFVFMGRGRAAQADSQNTRGNSKLNRQSSMAHSR